MAKNNLLYGNSYVTRIIKNNPYNSSAFYSSFNANYSNTNHARYGGASQTSGSAYYTMNTEFYNTLDSSVQNLIPIARWYIGDDGANNVNTYSYDVSNWYSHSRSSNTNCGATYQIDAKIGLPYIADYMYAVQSSNCARSIVSGSYNNCASYNWFYIGKSSYNWYTLSSQCRYNSTSGYRAYNIYITSAGVSTRVSGSSAYYLFPVFYLKNQIYPNKGNGTSSNPYYVAI